MGRKKKSNGTIRDRIKEFRRVRASDLLDNPKNWRKHPDNQRRVLRSVLERVGFADALIARETDDGLVLIDGHLRRGEVEPDQMLPVLILDVDEKDADFILSTIDPLSMMADVDSEKLVDIVESFVVDENIELLFEQISNSVPQLSIEELFVKPLDGVPQLPDGDKSPFQQMTFTLHDEQAGVVKKAISDVVGKKIFDDSVNKNKNGCALFFICKFYLESLK
jgi:hypothetical protein